MQPQHISRSPVAQGLHHQNGGAQAPRSPFLPDEAIRACDSYRDACRLAWKHRAEQGMTQAYLGMRCNLHPQHVSDFFHDDPRDSKGRKRKNLPPDMINAVELELGNRAISQYLARAAMLHYMEETVYGTRPL